MRRSTIESDQPTIAIRRYVSSRICPANFARVICVAGGPVLRRVIVRAPIFGCLANEELCNFLVDNVVDRTLGNKYPKGSERMRNFLQAVRKKLHNFQCSSHENRQRIFGFLQ
ncbi:hypothetical protein ACV36C_28305 [Pseudomonas aeruginosa]